jgi:predicted RNase H-like nuclease (RuvC/YqgF family)
MTADTFVSALPGLGAVTALVWLLARTFLRVEDRRDSEYHRLTQEIARKDLEILRLENKINEQDRRIDELESLIRIMRNAQ